VIVLKAGLSTGFRTTLPTTANRHRPTPATHHQAVVPTEATPLDGKVGAPIWTRREWLSLSAAGATAASLVAIAVAPVEDADAAEFTAGGTLVDRSVGVRVGNLEASSSRRSDNSNVLFDKDYYFKFGTAAPWIEPDSVGFPKTMPFTKVQQRYDALKKYQQRIVSGIAQIRNLKKADTDIADPTGADVYQLRPMGLMANAFLASENTGTTNELFLARWYVNEIYLLIADMRDARSREARDQIYPTLTKAGNSFLTLMNRVITSKVGDKFEYM
jgi:hypothetical protein